MGYRECKLNDEVRIIIAGSRNFCDYNLLATSVKEYLDTLDNSNIVIISGAARGADQLGEQFANEYRIQVKRFPANWNLYGKSAGPIRNRQMAEYAGEGRGILFAFWDGRSRGTYSMIDLAKKLGLEIHIINF